MERHDFTVEPNEWWHFNYKDWKEYPILDIPFDAIGWDQGSGIRDQGSVGEQFRHRQLQTRNERCRQDRCFGR